jgi:hypothetical protein
MFKEVGHWPVSSNKQTYRTYDAGFFVGVAAKYNSRKKVSH